MNSTARKIFTLSVKNLKSHRWLFSKMALAFAILVFMVCLFSSYALALHDMQQDLLYEDVSSNYLFSNEPIADIPNLADSFSVKHLSLVKKYNLGVSLFSADRIKLLLGSNTYSYNGYWDERIDVYAGGNFVTANDLTELSVRFGTTEYMVGRLPTAADEVMLSEEFLSWYGLSADDVLGKQLGMEFYNFRWSSIVTSDAKPEEFLMDTHYFTVCGVLSAHFMQLSGHESVIGDFCPYVYLSESNPLFSDAEFVTTKYVYALSDWPDEQHIEQLHEQYDFDYVGSFVLGRMSLYDNMQSIAVKIFVIVGSALGCSLVLMILLMMDKLIAVFSRDCGILLSCGIQWRQAKVLLLSLLLWVCLFALAFAAVLTAVSFYAINAAIRRYYWFSVVLDAPYVIALFAIGIAAVLLIATVYYLYAVRVMRSKTVKDFLNTPLN